MTSWILNVIRGFFAIVDKMVYWFVSLLISLFDNLSTIRLFDSDITKAFATRIFYIISIVMIFKVSFSIIKFIINPDDFSNNERGMGKVIQSVIITLVALASVQSIFEFSYNLQKEILDKNIIEKLILGIGNGVSSDKQVEIKNAIPFQVESSFITLNTEYVPEFNYDLDNGYECVSNGNKIPMYRDDGILSEDFTICISNLSDEGSSKSYSIDGYTKKQLDETGEVYKYAYEHNDVNMLLDLVNDKYKSADAYLFDYKFIISTIAGVFVAIMYLNFCIDLAIRSVKFGFLELIAPIPILSMIDPKSSKNGMMSKWLKQCINTYLGLFIRIAAVNFVVFVVNIIFSHKSVALGEVGTFTKVVILFGALMFAKELPKLLSDLLGIDLNGNFKMNPFSRLPGSKFMGGLTKATVGGVIGTAGSFIGHGLGTGLAAGGSLVGATVGAMRGRGWNYNSDRVANAWRNTGHSVGRRAVGILNDTRKALHLPGNDIADPFGKDSSSEYWSSMKHGEKLYEMDKRGKNIYNHDDFKKEVDQLKARKVAFGDAQAQYDYIKNDSNSSAADIAMASKKVKDCETSVNKSKERIEQMGKLSKYRGDYRNYTDFKNYKDYIEGPSATVFGGGSGTTASTTSSTTSSTTASSYSSSYSSSPESEHLRVHGLKNPTAGNTRVVDFNMTDDSWDREHLNNNNNNTSNGNNNPETPFDSSHMDG